METQKMSAFLRELRKERGLTQEQAAEELFVSSKTLSRWETGATIPDLGTLMKLAEYYKVDIKELIDGERREPREDPDKDQAAQQKDALQAAAEYSRVRERREVRQAVLAVLLPVILIVVTYMGILVYTEIRNAVSERSGEHIGAMIGKIVEYYPKEEDGSQKLRIDSDFGERFIRITDKTDVGQSVKSLLDAQETGVIIRIIVRYSQKDLSRADRRGETFVYAADSIRGVRTYSETEAVGETAN